MTHPFRTSLLALTLFATLAPGPLLGQQGKAGVKKKLDDREQRILDLFMATKKGMYEDGRVHLYYDFETKAQELIDDWSPKMKQTKYRVRWSRGAEGTATTIEDGIVIGDYGMWIQKGRFLPDVEVTVELLSVAPYRKGSLLGAVFYNPKKKTAIGTNDGNQIVYLRAGGKPAFARKPHPNEWKTITTNARRKIGFRFNGTIAEATYNKRKTVDTGDVPKFTKGFDVTGHPALAWNGSVQCFVFGITIEGRLDPEWVAGQLGEKSKKRRRK